MNQGAARRHYWTDGLTWACNTGIFVFGIVLAVLGAVLPSLFETVRLDPAQAGGLFLFLNFGALLATLSSGPLFDRFGFKGILITASSLTAVSFFWMAGAGSYTMLAAASFLLGVGGGGLNAGTNTLVADLYPEGPAVALNRLGIFFGIGTFFIPFLVGVLLDWASLTVILIITGFMGIVSALLFSVFPFPPSKHAAGFPLQDALKLLRHPAVLLLGILLFFQSGNEITTSGWMTTFLVDRISVTPAAASFYLSAFWAAVILGRLAASWILKRWSESSLVRLGALASALWLLLFILLPGPVSSGILAILIGFSMAGIFPSVLAQGWVRFPGFSGTVIGTLMGIALVGGMLIPWLSGLLVGKIGVNGALLLPIVGFIGVFAMQSFVGR